MNNMTKYVYILQDPITDDVKYVGVTKNPYKRHNAHITMGKLRIRTLCNVWVNSLLVKNLRPKFTIIDETNINEDWVWLERYWISQFITWGFNLTNMTIGGKGSSGTTQRIVAVSIFTKEGMFVKNFKSMSDCARFFKISPTTVSANCNSKTKIFMDDYQIRRGIITENITENNFKRKIGFQSKNNKGIICIDDGKYFESITKASIYYNILRSSISKYLTHDQKSIKCGKTFKYANT